MCQCVFCRSGKDVWTLVRRVCGSTLNAINGANHKLCVPLLMVVAAHKRDPAAFLKQNYPHLLDYCYDQPTPAVSVWLIRNHFFRDQATFHHALYHKAEAHAQLLLSSGCPTYVYINYMAFAFTGTHGTSHLLGTICQWMRPVIERKCPPRIFQEERVCVKNKDNVLLNTTVIGGLGFVAWRNVPSPPADMERIYRAELEWAVNFNKRKNERQLALKAACNTK